MLVILLAVAAGSFSIARSALFRPSGKSLAVIVPAVLVLSMLPLLAGRGTPPLSLTPSSWADVGFWTTTFVEVPGVAEVYNDVSCPASDYCLAIGPGSGPTLVVANGAPGGRWTSHTSTGAHGIDTYEIRVDCSDSRECVAFEPGFLVSDDGGLRWQSHPPPGTAPVLLASCQSPLHCVAVTELRQGQFLTKDEVFVTSDLGAAWRRASLPGGIWKFGSLSCAEQGWCLLVAQKEHGSSPSASVLLGSLDGGASWHLVRTPARVTEVLTAKPEQGGHWVVFATEVSASGRISTWSLATSNGGRSFVQGTDFGSVQAVDISCPSIPYCLAVVDIGERSFLVKSSNGGVSWSPPRRLPFLLEPGIGDMVCPTKGECVAVGWAFLVTAGVETTTDGGLRWSEAVLVARK